VARKRDDDWAEAKRRCRLSEEDVRMARGMGLSPLKLIKNIPSPSERWKAPVAEWVRELYRKRHHGRPLERPQPLPAYRERHRDSPVERRRPLPAPEEPEEWGEFAEFAGEDEDRAEPERTWDGEIAEQDRLLLRRQEELRAAAEFVAAAFAQLPVVERVVLFGSVAQPLRKEVPRFQKFRRAGVAVWHECKDVDVAVWLSDMSALKSLQKARGNAMNALLDTAGIGVAHHQVDVFLLEPGSGRYLGRLCHFGTCPKGKPECLVPGCGTALFLRQHEAFVLDPRSLDPARCVLLFDRARSFGPPSLDRWKEDHIPF
jgi:hypothetical protein